MRLLKQWSWPLQQNICRWMKLHKSAIVLATLFLWLTTNSITVADFSGLTFNPILAEIQDCFLLPYSSSRQLCIEGYRNLSDTPNTHPNPNNASSIKNCFQLPYAAKQLCLKQQWSSSPKFADNDPTDKKANPSIEDCFTLPYAARQSCLQRYQDLSKASQRPTKP